MTDKTPDETPDENKVGTKGIPNHYYELTVDNLKRLLSFNILDDLALLNGKGKPIQIGEEEFAQGTVSNNLKPPQKMDHEYFVYFYAGSKLTNVIAVFVQEDVKGVLPETLELSLLLKTRDSSDNGDSLAQNLKLPPGARLSFGSMSTIIFLLIEKDDRPPFLQGKFINLLWESQVVQRTEEMREIIRTMIHSNDELSNLPIVDQKPEERDSFFTRLGSTENHDLFPFYIASSKNNVEEQIVDVESKPRDETFDEFIKKAVESYKGRAPDPQAFDPLSYLRDFDPNYYMFTLENQRLLADTKIEDVLHLQPQSLAIIKATEQRAGFVLSFYGTCNGRIYPVCWMTDDFSGLWKGKLAKTGTDLQRSLDEFESKIPNEINIIKTYLAAIEHHVPYQREGNMEGLDEVDMIRMYKEQENKTPELYFLLMKGPYDTSYPVFVVKDLQQKVDSEKIAIAISDIMEFTNSFLQGSVVGGNDTGEVWTESATERMKDYIKLTRGMQEERSDLRYIGNGNGVKAPPHKRLMKKNKPDQSSFSNPPRYKQHVKKITDPKPALDPEELHGLYFAEGDSKLYGKDENRDKKTDIKDSRVTHPIPRECREMKNLKTAELTKAESISQYCFEYCPELIKVTAMRALIIKANAFHFCLKLEEVKIRAATNIEDFAFANCISLTQIKVPKLEIMGRFAFLGCKKLQFFVEPTNVGEFCDGAFQNCFRMKKLPKCLEKITKKIGARAFYHVGSANGKPEAKPVILTKVEEIGSRAFEKCDMFKTLEIKLVTSIEAHAFKSCKQLLKLVLHKATHIGSYAFMHCSNLTDVDAKWVTKIEQEAFRECFSLKRITAENITYIGDKAFRDCGKVVIKKDQYENFEYLGIEAFFGTKLVVKLTTLERQKDNYDLDKLDQIRKAFEGGKELRQKLLSSEEKKKEKQNDILLTEVFDV